MMAFPVSHERVLEKRGIRSDRFWTSRIPFLPIFRRAPFMLDVAALEQSQYWPREKIDAYTKRRIASLIHDARKLSFWNHHLTAFGEDAVGHFSSIPVISKKDFQQHGTREWIDRSLVPFSSPDHTSGSTGAPFDFYVDRSYELRAFAVCERMLRTAAGGKRPTVISLRPREKLGFIFFDHKLFYVKSYNSIRHRIEALAELLDAIKSDVILYGFPSAFVELARRVEESGHAFRVRAAISTGESIRKSERDLIEQRLKTKFFTNYATRELGWLAFECEHRTLHLNEEWAYVEVTDAHGTPLPYGEEGEIVVTPFDNRVMPLIRYNNGDRGIISDESCSCGRTLRTIKVSGRKTEFISFPDGRMVSLLDLSTIFDWFSTSIAQFRVEQTGEYEFNVLVIPGPDFQRNKDELHTRLLRLLHPRAIVTWSIVDEILAAQSGKAVYLNTLKRREPSHA